MTTGGSQEATVIIFSIAALRAKRRFILGIIIISFLSCRVNRYQKKCFKLATLICLNPRQTKKQAFACLTVYIRNASINSNPAVYAKIYTAEVSQSPFFFTSDLHSGVVSIAGMESTRKTKVLYVHSSSSPCIG